MCVVNTSRKLLPIIFSQMSFDNTFTNLDCLIAQIEHRDFDDVWQTWKLCLPWSREGEIHCTCFSEFDKDFKPQNAVQPIIDEEFLDGCMDATNAHTHSSR